MTFWASGITDKSPTDNTRLWSNFPCPPPPHFSPSSSLFDLVPLKMTAFLESLYCAADEEIWEIWFGGDGALMHVCWILWSQFSFILDQRPGTCKHVETQGGERATVHNRRGVCACVCLQSQEREKGKEGAELILSVYQKLHLSVIEFSPSSIVVVFVSGDGWMLGGGFSSLRCGYKYVGSILCSFAPIRFFSAFAWPWYWWGSPEKVTFLFLSYKLK